MHFNLQVWFEQKKKEEQGGGGVRSKCLVPLKRKDDGRRKFKVQPKKIKILLNL